MPKEVKVAQVQDFQDGDMREVALGDTKLVLARVQGKFYALHGECTHYGGPLAEGALNGIRVVCPWHQAAFDLTSGGLLEPPALDHPTCFTVDQYLKASEGVYAAGDIARFPDWRTGELIRIEHWRLAEQHGRTAAHNLAGKPAAFAGVPFFWSEHFDQFLQYVGYAAAWDDLIIQGDVAARNFLAFYVRGGRILAAAGLQQDRQLAALSELMRIDKLPSPDALRREPEFDFQARLKALQA